MAKKRPAPLAKAYIKSMCGMLKSNSSVTDELLRERAKDKKRETTKHAK